MKIDEKIQLLKRELELLNKEILKTESGYNTSLKFAEIIKDIDLTENKNYDIAVKMAKEAFSIELELLRTKITTIRKFSIETADYLDNQVNEYEKITRAFMDAWGLSRKPKKHQTENEGLKFMEALISHVMSYNRLHDMVNVARNSIRDTLKRIESNE